MPTKRHRLARHYTVELTFLERLELVIGPAAVSQFPTDAERRAAWEAHRDELLAKHSAGGPCWAQEEYDGTEDHRDA